MRRYFESNIGYVWDLPMIVCKFTKGIIGNIFTNGNQKTLNIFRLPMYSLLPMVPLVDHVVKKYHTDQNTSLVLFIFIFYMHILFFIKYTCASITKYCLFEKKVHVGNDQEKEFPLQKPRWENLH